MTAPTDRPPIPQVKRSLLPTIWAVLVAGSVAGYALVGVMGWDFAVGARDTMPAGMRSSPGGYRTFHFWHSGYHGGK